MQENDDKMSYQMIVEKLALNKIRNELLFIGMVDEQLKALNSKGINVTREELLDDINKEVAKQRINFGIEKKTVEKTRNLFGNNDTGLGR